MRSPAANLFASLVLTLAAMTFLPRAIRADDASESPASFDPTSRYEEQTLEGWKVLIHRDLLDDAELAEPTLTLLRHQLYQMTRVVPAPALEKLRQVTIWVEKDEPHHPCMAYHPDAGWLREHDMNPEKARCVEVANAATFLAWTRAQPWMVLHEMAHAYHHQFLEEGYDNPDVTAVYRRAMDEKRYHRVLHIQGEHRKGYATTNPMEYFAETAEAYFGTNDFFPYVRSELQEHDPAGYALHERLWRAK
jgi:hypothetical protein